MFIRPPWGSLPEEVLGDLLQRQEAMTLGYRSRRNKPRATGSTPEIRAFVDVGFFLFPRRDIEY